ncbi:MAG TPA: aminotransferase class V-fold PLP-dependent enzyme [Burkholderiales bacterium]|nr:aminotransferase class V-fold PLP-dependent enzyme [Burkholderiales bacterium]
MNRFGQPLRREFRLEPGVDFINHGSFGAPPVAVLAQAERWRSRMEANPDDFLRNSLPAALRAAAAELARFLHAEPADLVFVENATSAINAVLRSLEFRPGDEILLNSQSYGAVRQAVRFVCDRTGARSVEPCVGVPVRDAAELVQTVAAALSARTRLVIVDHISSPTGVIWPTAEIVALARSHGAQVLVDGAHAPGQLELDLPALGADWYAGNCHKWLFAARGCGFLWSRRVAQAELHPLAISHAYATGFTAEFDWTGTRDFSAWLAAGAGIRFLQDLGAEPARRYSHALVLAAADKIARAWGEPLGGPPALHGFMTAIRLPARWQRDATRESAAKLQSVLMREHRIAVAIMAIEGALWARISAQVYNAASDYERLLDVGLRGLG